MTDGAHTHGHGSGGVGAAVAIGAGAVLAIAVAEAIARVWPYVLAGVAVTAGLWAAAWITRTVITYRQQQAAWHAEVTAAYTDPRDREIAVLRQAVEDLHARLGARHLGGDRPGLERHEHVHFHGLAADQIAALLALRQQARQQDGDGKW